MKRPFLVTAASLLALGATNIDGAADAMPLRTANPAEAEAYKSAVANGSVEALQAFLAQYPASPLAGNVFGELVQKVRPQRLENAPAPRIWQIYNDDANQQRRALIPHLAESRDALARIQRARVDLRFDLTFCNADMPLQRLKDCLAEALNDFAADIEKQEINLPEPLKTMPDIVRQAAEEVRLAPTAEEARAAVATAVASVRSSIELLQAGTEGGAVRVQVRTGETVISALELVDAKLEEAVGL